MEVPLDQEHHPPLTAMIAAAAAADHELGAREARAPRHPGQSAKAAPAMLIRVVDLGVFIEINPIQNCSPSVPWPEI